METGESGNSGHYTCSTLRTLQISSAQTFKYSIRQDWGNGNANGDDLFRRSFWVYQHTKVYCSAAILRNCSSKNALIALSLIHILAPFFRTLVIKYGGIIHFRKMETCEIKKVIFVKNLANCFLCIAHKKPKYGF